MSHSQEQRKARLLAAAFAEMPIFRIGYDRHVQAYRRHIGSEAYITYHTDPAFASAYEARVAEQRAMPMPAWKSTSMNGPSS